MASMPTPPLLAALLTAAYFCLGLAAPQLLAFQPPNWFEQLISLFAAPAVILLTLWNPLLQRFGLTSGEWFVMPSLGASVALIALYALLAFGITAGVRQLTQR